MRLSMSGVTTAEDVGRPGLQIAGLQVRAHEIVGVAGVSGNGQKELLEVLGGQRPATAGRVTVSGQVYGATRRESQALHVRVLPEEPLRNGCVPTMSVVDNLNLRQFDRSAEGPRRWLNAGEMRRRAERMISGYGVRRLLRMRRLGCFRAGMCSAACWRGSWMGRCRC